MSARKRGITDTPGVAQRALETLLFILASLVGVYGIGQGLAGFYEPGQSINPVWLAAAGVAVFVLFAQMGRVHDTWAHKPPRTDPTASGPDEPRDRGGKVG